MLRKAMKIMFLYFYISAFCSLSDRLTDKIFTEKMLMYDGNLHRKNLTLFSLATEKNAFPPKPYR